MPLINTDLSRVKGVPREQWPPWLRKHEARYAGGDLSESTIVRLIATGLVKTGRVGSIDLIDTASFLAAIEAGVDTPRTPRKTTGPTRAGRPPKAKPATKGRRKGRPEPRVGAP